MKHLFFNCQTLGRKPGCGIVEVGYATFSDLEVLKETEQKSGEITIPVEQNLVAGFTADADTMKWWLEKQGGLRPNLRMPERPHASMSQLLSELSSQWDHLWFNELVRNVWCKIPQFHIEILCAAFDKLQVQRPILLREENFRGWKCASTLLNLNQFHLNLPMNLIASSSLLNEKNYKGRATTEALNGANNLSYLLISLIRNRNASIKAADLQIDKQKLIQDILEREKEIDRLRAKLGKRKSKKRSR